MISINHLDHFVLTVADISKSAEFYKNILGMNIITFGTGRTALTFGNQKINLHQSGYEFEPKALNVQTGSADLCFITTNKLTEAMQHVTNQGIDIIEGPVKRTGSQGPIMSFYFRDPDGNLIEVSTDSNI